MGLGYRRYITDARFYCKGASTATYGGPESVYAATCVGHPPCSWDGYRVRRSGYETRSRAVVGSNADCEERASGVALAPGRLGRGIGNLYRISVDAEHRTRMRCTPGPSACP